ncbi:protein IQ-DOMAIN 21-like [Oryza glaberrima]|uniref:protein IQ-DOMAIN 21-like n=1 Tax=Oryza glaberrima TaxID=4538 RepID=UPI00224C02C0|nr:protein IQ-DOMAIN 21-like [Oryza glaberrima]
MNMARSNLLCCLGTRREDNARQRQTRPTPRPRLRRLMSGMKRVFGRSPPCGQTAVAPDSGIVVVEPRRQTAARRVGKGARDGGVNNREEISREEAAAATIQAGFRGHLARRAFRALRSLVKLQALARGSCVRKQAGVAIRFMKVLVRLQVRVRARQLLHRSKDQ